MQNLVSKFTPAVEADKDDAASPRWSTPSPPPSWSWVRAAFALLGPAVAAQIGDLVTAVG